jgi:hypothetical protein
VRTKATKPLFAWDSLEDSPTLKTIRQLLDVIPDQPLLDSLRAARGKGRDDIPVGVARRVLVLSIALRHSTIEHCLGNSGVMSRRGSWSASSRKRRCRGGGISRVFSTA